MSRSLRRQLLVRTALTTIVVSALATLAIFLLLRRRLIRDFDAVLESKAVALATLVEVDQGELVLEFASQPPAEFTRGERPEYYEAWDDSGSVLVRSPQLGGSDLEQLNPTTESPLVRAVVLPDGRPGRMVTLAVAPRLEAGQSEGITAATEAAGEQVAGAASASNRTVTLAVAADTLDVAATIARLGATMAIAAAVIVLFLLWALAWVIRQALEPLGALAKQFDAVHVEALDARFSLDGAPAELGPVVARANELMRRLEQAFERERTFSADVAHELRTPLAGVRATAEVALSRQRGAGDYRGALESCLAMATNLQRLVETLFSLTLAAPAAATERSYVDLAYLIGNSWTPFDERAAQKGLSLSFELPHGVLLHTEAPKVRVVLSNLFDNAVEYANEGGQIAIAATFGEDGMVIRIANSGCRLSDEQLPRVFDRFWRADKARHERTHAGLGLALSRRIVQSLGGTIFADREQQWFAVTIGFPPDQVELADANEAVEAAAQDDSAC
jgi:two-component system sensor histidine kinase QseC